jgi:hypothetical protein
VAYRIYYKYHCLSHYGGTQDYLSHTQDTGALLPHLLMPSINIITNTNTLHNTIQQKPVLHNTNSLVFSLYPIAAKAWMGETIKLLYSPTTQPY